MLEYLNQECQNTSTQNTRILKPGTGTGKLKEKLGGGGGGLGALKRLTPTYEESPGRSYTIEEIHTMTSAPGRST